MIPSRDRGRLAQGLYKLHDALWLELALSTQRMLHSKLERAEMLLLIGTHSVSNGILPYAHVRFVFLRAVHVGHMSVGSHGHQRQVIELLG